MSLCKTNCGLLGLLLLLALAVTSSMSSSLELPDILMHLGHNSLQLNATSSTYRQIIDVNGKAICALDKPWKNWQIAGGPDQCADACSNHLEGCVYFNYKTGDRCDLYDCFPLTYDVVGECRGYQREDTVVSCEPDAQGSVSARCCSFPFTWNGNVQLACTAKSATDPTLGCLVNGQWFKCQQPANYMASWESVILADSTLVFAVNQWIIASNKVKSGGSTNFNQPWASYQSGFGVLSLADNYWIGLETLRYLTSKGRAQLRIEILRGDQKWYSAEYSSFVVGDESSQYQLTFDSTSYRGDAGDALSPSSNGMKFSTMDRDNDRCKDCQCAVDNQSGWWYSACGGSIPIKSPNGIWSTDSTPANDVIASRILVKQEH